MARNFNGTSDKIDCGNVTGLNSASAFTLAYWGQRTGSSDMLAVEKTVDNNNSVYLIPYTDGNLYVKVANGSNSYATVANNSTAMNHWCLVYDGSQSGNANRLKAYVNGTGQTLSFTGTIPATTANLASVSLEIGHSATVGYSKGNVAEVALWSAALTANDVLSLFRGFAPLLIRPEALLNYWPLLGVFSPELDFRGGLGGTLTGTTQANHPGILYPAAPLILETPAAAALSTLFRKTLSPVGTHTGGRQVRLGA